MYTILFIYIEHHIYDNKLGFFNGISLTILVAKVLLLYPMASMPFLIEKPWPTPVKLTDLPNWRTLLRWTSHEEIHQRNAIYSTRGLMPDLTLPIITPGHIEQNATFNVNKSSATIIQLEMQNAIRLIRDWPNLTMSQEEKWENLLRGKKFEEQYSHYIRIECKAFLLTDFDDFCGYVETRIRLQLLIYVERFDHIRKAHAKLVIENEQLPEKGENGSGINCEQQKEFYHKIWLVGLEFDDDTILTEDEAVVEKHANLLEWIQRFNSMLSNQFDIGIEMAYRKKKNLVGPLKQIQLTSEYMKKEMKRT